jgi:transposase
VLTATPPRIFVAIAPVDLRRGLDGLCALVQHELALSPFDGTWYLFRNRAATRLKLVVFDGTGFWLCYRRLERGTWVWPNAGDQVMTLSYAQFLLLVQGQDWRRVQTPAEIRPSLI